MASVNRDEFHKARPITDEQWEIFAAYVDAYSKRELRESRGWLVAAILCSLALLGIVLYGAVWT